MSLYGAVDLTVFKDDICKIILKNHQIFVYRERNKVLQN